MKVFHDPGHGGDNKGCERYDLIERNWVVELSNDLVKALSGFGVEQRLSRTEDVTLPYEDRAADAWEWGANLVLCHHINAMVDDETGRDIETADGLLVFAAAYDSESLAIADAIMRAAPLALRVRSPKAIPTTLLDWTRRAHSVMTPYVRRQMKTALIEWGFATSPRDRATLTSNTSRPALCAAAAAGVARAFELSH